MGEHSRDVANMDVVALEVRFKKHNSTIVDGAIDEVVYEQIQPHARGCAEDGSEAKRHSFAGIQKRLLGFDLGRSIQRNRAKRSFFRAGDAFFADTVA